MSNSQHTMGVRLMNKGNASFKKGKWTEAIGRSPLQFGFKYLMFRTLYHSYSLQLTRWSGVYKSSSSLLEA
jgi:hypothetical protein